MSINLRFYKNFNMISLYGSINLIYSRQLRKLGLKLIKRSYSRFRVRGYSFSYQRSIIGRVLLKVGSDMYLIVRMSLILKVSLVVVNKIQNMIVCHL